MYVLIISKDIDFNLLPECFHFRAKNVPIAEADLINVIELDKYMDLAKMTDYGSENDLRPKDVESRIRTHYNLLSKIRPTPYYTHE